MTNALDVDSVANRIQLLAALGKGLLSVLDDLNLKYNAVRRSIEAHVLFVSDCIMILTPLKQTGRFFRKPLIRRGIP